MNRDEIVTHFVELSGRYDLVSDAIASNYANASPIGANFFVNSAVRWLENKVNRRKEYLWERVDIAVGQVLQTVKNVKSFKEVWIMNVDGRTILVKKSIGWLRENYGAASGIVDDKPKYWAPVPVGFSINERGFGPELIADGGFYEGNPLVWTAGGNWGIASGLATIGTASASTLTHLATVTLVVGTTYVLEYTVVGRTAGSVTPTVGGVGLTARSTNGIFTQNVTPTSTSGISFLSSAAFLGSIDNVSLKEVFRTDRRDFTFDVDDVVLGDTYDTGAIMWMPPTDAVYTLSILAQFYERELINGTDVNFWSSQFPETLIQAAMLMLERFYRNTEGVRDHQAAILDDLRGIDFEIVEEEISGINTMQG